jgi:tubulin-specific chaperone A
MSDKPAIHRQLNIKSGVAKRHVLLQTPVNSVTLTPPITFLRLLKEHVLYAKEAEEQQQKVDKLIADNAEGWDIRSAVCGR